MKIPELDEGEFAEVMSRVKSAMTLLIECGPDGDPQEFIDMLLPEDEETFLTQELGEQYLVCSLVFLSVGFANFVHSVALTTEANAQDVWAEWMSGSA